MPFPEQTARPYTKADVESLNEKQVGCYGLFINGGSWVYIGKGDIRTRLLAHLNGDNPCIIKMKPTHWKGSITSDYDAEEKRLILEFDPVCNKKVG